MSDEPQRDLERLFAAVFDAATDAFMIVDDDGVYTDVNAAACALFGLPRDELVGRSPRDFADEGYPARTAWTELLQVGRMRGEFPLRRLDGTKRLLEFSAVANVLPGRHLSVLRDVTERGAAEQGLREYKQLLEEAEAVANLGSWSWDGTSAPIRWSSECARMFGGRPEAPPTIDEFWTSVHPEDRARIVEASYRAMATGDALESEHRLLVHDTVRWVDTRTVIQGELRWDGERPLFGPAFHLLGVVKDITERKQSALAARSTDQRYRQIVEHTSEGIWMYDGDGQTLFANRRMAELVGCSQDEMVGRPVFEFFDPDDHAAVRERLARRRQGVSARGEVRLRRCDGTSIWVLFHADPLLDEQGQLQSSLALLTDVTERRAAEDMRRRLAAIVESSDDAIVSLGIDGIVQTWNRGAEKLTGYTAAEVIGRHVSMVYPPERRLDSVTTSTVLEQYEMVIVRKDGLRVEVSLTTSVLRDDAGEVIGTSLIARDISERMRAQAALQRTEEQLRQAQKMEAIGSLAGGVAHDFNNLLTVIMSYTELILEELPGGDPLRDDVEEVRRAGQRAAELTRQLLAFSRKQLMQPVVLNLNEVVSGVRKMLGRLLGEDIELSLVLAPDAGKVHADAGQIEQVIMNLVVNARDAMPRGGRLTIETANVALDANYGIGHAQVAPGNYVMLAISDSGVGMERAVQARIFEPFFTTKDKSKGTGLGLSTVYGIVQQSGGHIYVYSEPGQGTTFKVYLPSTDRAADGARADAAELTSLRGSETVLLVEDDATVRNIVRSVLRKNGYNVLESENGGEALLICEQYQAPIQLLLTDVVMPRMSGRQLAERLARDRPDMKVLFVSGYTEDTIVHHGVLDAGIEFLAKPITPDALLRKVRQVLDGVRAGR